MNASELFVPVPPTGKAPRLTAGQFEFAIDRNGQKILDLRDIVTPREQIRVQTNRLFTWNGGISVPDNSTGMIREVDCVLEFEGFVEPNEEAARTILKAALEANFDFDGLICRLLAGAIDRQRVALNGSFLQVMRDPARRNELLEGVRRVLGDGGLPITKLSLLPLQRDQREFLDFEDIPGTLTIRSSETLKANTVGYKARLRWGREDEQRNARLVYRGTMDGPVPGPALAAPLVPGQIQPLEAWFRTLLTDALARHPWASVLANDTGLLDTVRAEVSALLGRGTGRVVEALDILPSTGSQVRLRERTVSFTHQYPITGVQDSSLTIEHTLGYALRDRDRWVAQGLQHPEEVIKPQVVEATRAFLAGKRFKDVVTLYLLAPQGEAKFRDAITSRVTPYFDAIGVRIVSAAVILSIPGKNFIEGRRLSFPTAAYSLADPNLAPPMKLTLVARVASTTDAREAFARALTEHDTFEGKVSTEILDAVRGSLRRVGALDYYASRSVNGAPGAYPGTAMTEMEEDPVIRRLRNDVDAELRTKFGLEVVRIDLQPGDTDPLIERMKALMHLSINLPAETSITFERGDEATRVWLEAEGTIFIVSIDPANWSSFYNNAARIESAEAHGGAIVATLMQTLRMTRAAIVQPGLTDARAAALRQLVVDEFTARVSKEFGLLVQLRPLMLRIKRPEAGDTADYILRDLHEELQRLSRQRSELRSDSTYDDGERRDAITQRIRAVREEIAEEEKPQEAVIEKTETIYIEQDRDTGRLINHAFASEAISEKSETSQLRSSDTPIEEFRTVTLYFGTDRKLRPGAGKPHLLFSSERAGGVAYGHCDVSIPLKHRKGDLEGPFLGAQCAIDPKRHIALLKVCLLPEDEFFNDIHTKTLPGNTRKSLIFVHGFNNSFQDAARRTAQIFYDVGFVGVPLFYSWPSNGSLKDYEKDGNQAEQAIVHLKGFMRDVALRGNFDSITLIAHSMGSRALARAFLSLKSELSRKQLRLFREIILAAPDIDADVFRDQIAPELITMPTVTTLYASSRDHALQYSKKRNGAPRAGDSGVGLVVLDGIETIDATNADTNLFWGLRHSYVADSKDLLSDLFYLIEHRLRARERHNLESITVPPATSYWRFRR